jgi:hypothetical protein
MEDAAVERPCWTLNHATDGIGRVYPQLEGFAAEFAPGHAEALAELPRGRLPDDMAFPVAVLARGAKPTDLLSSVTTGNFGFLVSDRLRFALDGFRLPPHRFFAAPLEHRGRPIGAYWWLHLPQPDLPLGEDTPPGEAESVISADPVVGTADLLRVYSPSRYRNCFVSGAVRAALEAAGITGVRFGTAKVFR